MTQNLVRWAFSLTLLLAMSSVPILAGSPSTPVTAVVMPEGRYSKTAVREMGREAGHILKQSGVSLRVRVGVPSQPVSGWLVVVKLVGDCDMDGSPASLVPGPLAWAHVVNGTILPFSGLACNNLRGAVQAAMLAHEETRGNILLGRAMGRVLAHELYHIVADRAEHSQGGVTQRALTPQQLTSGPLELPADDVQAIEDGLRGDR